MKSVLFSILALWVFILPPLASASARFLDVIVVLDAAHAPGGHAANRSQAAGIARSMGFAARHAYGAALFGFAARIPEGRLNALQRDPRVAYVDLDRQVSLPVPRTAGPRKCVNNPDAPGCGSDDGTSG